MNRSLGVSDPTASAPGRLAFVGHYVTTMRPYLAPVSAVAGLAGISLTGPVDTWRWVPALAVFALSYGFGQALTDCFQRDTDRMSSPYRPLIQGKISPGGVLAASLLGLASGMAILTWLNPWNLALSACAVAGLLIYTPLKRLWWAGPAANAWVVALLPIMGWLVGPGNVPAGLAREPALICLSLTTLTAYANFVLVGYLKDVAADRAAHYRTMPVVFGRRATAFASHVWSLLALGSCLAAVLLIPQPAAAARAASGAMLAVAACASLATQWTVHRTRRQNEAYRPTLGTVRVFLLLHAAVIWAARPQWAVLPMGLYLAFEVLVRLRPERRQI